MRASRVISTDEIRSRFSAALSDMYRREVPQYGTLLDLVADINAAALHAQAGPRPVPGEAPDRLAVERHGAIRLGTAHELFNIRRVFAVMGMVPVGYYDLSGAGIPVHSTAFRPVDEESLARNPFRVFTSLLRLELISDARLRAEAARILARRNIVAPRAMAWVEVFEQAGGLTSAQADEFVTEALEIFRWHGQATVDSATYRQLHEAHRLVADIVCFNGPHINHLTPRILDIDAAHAEMPRRGLAAKDVIEGPPRRKHSILLRQTSFKALEERIDFMDGGGDNDASGTHTARFGEIEQRGMALTRAGRDLYDRLLVKVRDNKLAAAGASYSERLVESFTEFPDELASIRQAQLAFFTYSLTDAGWAAAGKGMDQCSMDLLVAEGLVTFEPITYEDFLPVSAAGIFQSNLGGALQGSDRAHEAKAAFEEALGASVRDEMVLYALAESRSMETVRRQLRDAK